MHPACWPARAIYPTSKLRRHQAMFVQAFYGRHTDRRLRVVLLLGVATLVATALLPLVLRESAPRSVPEAEKVKTATLPLAFEPNAGQADSAVRYVAHAPVGTLLFTASEVVLALGADGAAQSKPGQPDGRL